MKHAFLILAHANFPLVSRLLKKLDHADNTIYVHVDAKSHFTEQDDALASDLRSVDWDRGDKSIGSPYTFTVDDYDALLQSPNLFCRKITDSTPEGVALIEKLEAL